MLEKFQLILLNFYVLLSFFSLKIYFSLKQYILTTISPPSTSLSFSSNSLLSWIHMSSDSHQKRVDLQEITTKRTKLSKIRQSKSSYTEAGQGIPTGRKNFQKQGKESESFHPVLLFQVPQNH